MNGVLSNVSPAHATRHSSRANPIGLNVPPNITLVPLPAKCPELNPQEDLRQYMRDNWFLNQVFTLTPRNCWRTFSDSSCPNFCRGPNARIEATASNRPEAAGRPPGDEIAVGKISKRAIAPNPRFTRRANVHA